MSIEGLQLKEEDLTFHITPLPVGTERIVYVAPKDKAKGILKPTEPRIMKVIGEDTITLIDTGKNGEKIVEELRGKDISRTWISLKPFKTKVNYIGKIHYRNGDEK